MVDLAVGEIARAVVVLRDASGNETDNYDVLSGISYTSSNPAAVNVIDEDADPQDARVEAMVLTDAGEDVFIDVSFDGRVGPDENFIHLQSEAIHVVPGEAVGGEVKVIKFEQV